MFKEGRLLEFSTSVECGDCICFCQTVCLEAGNGLWGVKGCGDTTYKNADGNFWETSPGTVAGRGAPPELMICILFASSFDLVSISAITDGTAATCEIPSSSTSLTATKAVG